MKQYLELHILADDRQQLINALNHLAINLSTTKDDNALVVWDKFEYDFDISKSNTSDVHEARNTQSVRSLEEQTAGSKPDKLVGTYSALDENLIKNNYL